MAMNINGNSRDGRDIRAANANAANIGYARDTQDGDTVYTSNQRAGYVAAAPMGYNAAPVSRTVGMQSEIVDTKDRVRWGPIVAGIFSAIATLLILSLLGVAVGLTAAAGDPRSAAGATNEAGNYGVGAAIWAGLSTLIAFFVGGFVAGRNQGVLGKGSGWINGALVWAVTIPLLLWLASSGAAGFLNAIGFDLNGFFNTVNPSNPESPLNPTNPANPTNPTSPNNPANNPGAVQNATETARNGAWGTLAALLVGLIAAGLGGLVGGRTHPADDEVATSTAATTTTR
jgi:hypothetical protein